MIVRAPRSEGALHAVEPDAAGADHHHRGPWLDLCRVHHRTQARDHATGEQGRDVERHVGGNRHHLRGVHGDPLGERAGAHRLQQRRATGIAQRRLGIEAESASQ